MMEIASVVFLVILLVVVWIDGYGNALGYEQDIRVYELNESIRSELGKKPVPWPGSMAAYNRDCAKADATT